MNRSSWLYFSLSCLILIAAHAYYPKWKQQGIEATLTWDVSGYYMYLPAAFIYKDIKQCRFQDEVLQEYQPTFDFQQAFKHEPSGNYVFKYPIGQAIQMAPFFAIGHLWAAQSPEYKADGFSFPYQVSIGLGSLLIAFIGLFFLFKVLRFYYSTHITGFAILGIVLGSNYLEYAAISGAMTHNNLFTINTIIIWLTIRYYQEHKWWQAIGIGLLIGLAALTRPTEILIALIPLLWNLNAFSKSSWQGKLSWISRHRKKLIVAALTTMLMGSIQLMYWKYVSGQWIVYSYEDQGFSWLSPHIMDGLFSYRAGWLMYAPFMVFSIIGFYYLYNFRKELFWPLFIYAIMMIYVTFAWDIWWYGGSLGQRGLVQVYPALAFPLAMFLKRYGSFQWSWKLIIGFLMVTFIYINIWWTVQAHKGGMFRPAEMTGPYYWKVIGRWSYDKEYEKLLDATELYEGDRSGFRTVYTVNEATWTLNQDVQYAPLVSIPVESIKSATWVSITGDYLMPNKEWEVWKMPQVQVRFMKDSTLVKQAYYRIARLLDSGTVASLYFDVKVPEATFDRLEIKHWNADGDKVLTIQNLTVQVK